MIALCELCSMQICSAILGKLLVVGSNRILIHLRHPIPDRYLNARLNQILDRQQINGYLLWRRVWRVLTKRIYHNLSGVFPVGLLACRSTCSLNLPSNMPTINGNLLQCLIIVIHAVIHDLAAPCKTC